mmetsp:Transcript_22360/g.62223  ORF Transcript_22360/g.62223 Transcript_22360/m.62223 type:complete len:140 (+) Transcript_22360:666-1085(+)
MGRAVVVVVVVVVAVAVVVVVVIVAVVVVVVVVVVPMRMRVVRTVGIEIGILLIDRTTPPDLTGSKASQDGTSRQQCCKAMLQSRSNAKLRFHLRLALKDASSERERECERANPWSIPSPRLGSNAVIGFDKIRLDWTW